MAWSAKSNPQLVRVVQPGVVKRGLLADVHTTFVIASLGFGRVELNQPISGLKPKIILPPQIQKLRIHTVKKFHTSQKKKNRFREIRLFR